MRRTHDRRGIDRQEFPQDAPVWCWGFGSAFPLTDKTHFKLSEIYRYEPWLESQDEENWQCLPLKKWKLLETKTVLLIG